MATFNFTNGPDGVDAYEYPDTVNTYNFLKGEDLFYGAYARAIVHGGDGADKIYGGYGNDTLYGDTGWDRLEGNEGADTIYGGDGNDEIRVNVDGYRDVVFGGNGNDQIGADGDKVDGGAGDDRIFVSFNVGDGVADVTGGIGRDTFSVNGSGGEDGSGPVNVRDLKAEDHLRLSAYLDAEGISFDHGQVLDRLDVNNDGWLGAKDVEAVDYDGFSVHVGSNYLELDVQAVSVFLHGMTKASFDFLA